MHQEISPEDFELALDRAAVLVRAAERVAVVTGAGVSAESGVPTFRDGGGLWEGHNIEDVATPVGFRRDPGLVWRFYNSRRAALLEVRPNPGHFALKALEERLGPERLTLITQNIDGLHRAAGSRNVLELHGNLARVRCTGCERVEDRGGEVLPELPHCSACGALLRPDVVWFFESLPVDVWREAESRVRECQCLLVIGTSAVVHPAATLVPIARDQGARVIEINLTPTKASQLMDVALHGPAGQVLPRLMERVASPDSLRRPAPAREVTPESSERVWSERLVIMQGDITHRQVEAIVNAANNSLLGGGGVDGAIHTAAGPELLEECRQRGWCSTGAAKLTRGYRLPAKFVIHTVGPVWNGGDHGEAELLAHCYRSCFALVEKHGIRSVAFPAISTGAYRFPVERACRIALAEIKDFLERNTTVERVSIACIDRRVMDCYLAAFEELSERDLA
jgi:NAD-dependent deacetylase